MTLAVTSNAREAIYLGAALESPLSLNKFALLELHGIKFDKRGMCGDE